MKKQLKVLYVCVFVLMIGYGITLPVLPFYIERLVTFDGVTTERVSTHVGILTGLFALMQFIFAPIWGRLSDRMGRRPFFLISLGGYAISMIFFGLGSNLVTLYTARIVGGIFSSALFPVANAYIVDITPKSKCCWALAWLGTSIGLGIVVGPIMGGLLAQMKTSHKIQFGYFTFTDFSILFFIAAALALVTLAIANILLPETVRQAETQPDSLLNKINLKNIQAALQGTTLFELLVLSFISQFALALFEGTFAIHSFKLLNFGAMQMGVVFMVCGLVMAVAQAFIVARLIEQKGAKPLLPLGFGLMGTALILLMRIQSNYGILMLVAMFALGMAFLIPSLALLVTKLNGRNLGAVLGLQSSANSLGQAFGPMAGGLLINRSAHLPYFLTGGLLIATMVFLLFNNRYR